MESQHLKDKVVVVTGGAVGIGYHIADNYLKSKAKVVIILDINEEQGNEAVQKLKAKYGASKAVFIKCDATKDLETVCKDIFDKFKTVDVLVNNAGILNEADWKKCIDINVTSLIGWSLKFMEHMRKDSGGVGGTIVNIASIYGFRAEPYIPTYTASKFAVMGFTRSLGGKSNYDRTGVRVVAVCPGFTKTALATDGKTWDTTSDQLQVEFQEYLKTQLWQEASAVGPAAVEIFERADSGTAWLIEGGKPVEKVV